MSDPIRLEIDAAIHDFKFHEAGLRELMQGPVTRDLVRRAVRVEASAKEYATGVGGGPNVRTGRLRGSITWRIGTDPVSPFVDIGSAVVYAPFVELGTSRMPAYPYLRPGLEAARTV